MTITKYGTKLTEGELEYRRQLIELSRSIFCPVSYEMLSVNDGEIILARGNDYFVSTKGVEILEEIFGKEYIEKAVISYD